MDGYFPRVSVARRALGRRAVALTYGQRALTVGALHPVLLQGTVQSTAHRERPYTRLARTARLFEAVFLGSRAEADRALAFVRRRHQQVHGVTADDGGRHAPAGTPYDAFDPGLMWWTAAFALDSVEVQHDRLVRRLTDAEREDLVADFVTFAELFGMPRSAGPSSYAAFRAGFDAFVASDRAHLTEEARLLGRYVSGYQPSLRHPPHVKPVFTVLDLVVVGSLGGAVRERFGMEWSLADEAAYQAVTRASRLAHGRLPALATAPVLRGRSRGFYAYVGRRERHQLRRGVTSMPGVSDRVVLP